MTTCCGSTNAHLNAHAARHDLAHEAIIRHVEENSIYRTVATRKYHIRTLKFKAGPCLIELSCQFMVPSKYKLYITLRFLRIDDASLSPASLRPKVSCRSTLLGRRDERDKASLQYKPSACMLQYILGTQGELETAHVAIWQCSTILVSRCVSTCTMCQQVCQYVCDVSVRV